MQCHAVRANVNERNAKDHAKAEAFQQCAGRLVCGRRSRGGILTVRGARGEKYIAAHVTCSFQASIAHRGPYRNSAVCELPARTMHQFWEGFLCAQVSSPCSQLTYTHVRAHPQGPTIYMVAATWDLKAHSSPGSRFPMPRTGSPLQGNPERRQGSASVCMFACVPPHEHHKEQSSCAIVGAF